VGQNFVSDRHILQKKGSIGNMQVCNVSHVFISIQHLSVCFEH
jgi:hypothetical protein